MPGPRVLLAGAIVVLAAAPLGGCGSITRNDVEASVSRDLQARVNRTLARRPGSAASIVTFGDVICKGPSRPKRGSHLRCRAFGSRFDGSERLTFIADVRVTDDEGHVAYTLRRPRAGEG